MVSNTPASMECSTLTVLWKTEKATIAAMMMPMHTAQVRRKVDPRSRSHELISVKQSAIPAAPEAIRSEL